MDHEPNIVRVPSSPSRGPSILVAAAVLLVALAVVKPWAAGGDRSAPVPVPTAVTGLGSRTSPLPGLTPRPTQAVWDPNLMACMSSEGDRLLAFMRGPGMEVRTWLVLGDAAVTDPLDPAAVALRLPSSHVIGLGVCERRLVQADEAASAGEIVDVRSVTTSGGMPVLTDLGQPIVITQDVGAPDAAVLYGPPAGPPPRSGGPHPGPSAPLGPSATSTAIPSGGPWPTWPIGEYALGFRFAGDGQSILRWLRLDIVPAVGMYD